MPLHFPVTSPSVHRCRFPGEGEPPPSSTTDNFTTEQLNDLGRLLKRTTLAAIVAAAKTIVDRLDFIASLPTLLYEEEIAEDVLEVAHLERLVAENTWIFGDAHPLMAADQGLTNVLKRLLTEPGRAEVDPAPVLIIAGERALPRAAALRALRPADAGRPPPRL